MAPILSRDRSGSCLRLLLQILAPCVASDVVDIALWGCRILARAGTSKPFPLCIFVTFWQVLAPQSPLPAFPNTMR